MGIRSKEELDDIIRGEEEYDRRQLAHYDATKVKLDRECDPIRSSHLRGTVSSDPRYTFRVKVYDVGSEYGIDEGRISKLHLFKMDKEVVTYDRGWSAKPHLWDLQTKAAFAEVKAAFARDVPKDARLSGADEKLRRDEGEVLPYAVPADDAAARPANPMGFFKKQEPAAPTSRKDWTRTQEPARHTSAPIADHTDDNDHTP